ncbi:MAG: tetratricopeptide repeat protein [Myxococcaceae bacterium]
MERLNWEEAKAIAQVGCEMAAAGRLEEARVIFEGLLDGNPNDSAVLAALGTVYQKLGRSDDALSVYDSAVNHDPRNPVALGNRGELKLRAGDRNGFSDLARAIEADPHGETQAGRRAKSLVREITAQAVKHLTQK